MENNPITDLNKVIRGSNRATYDMSTIYEILDDAFLCHVGYVYDHKAVVIPTAYGRMGNSIYIHGSLKNRMMLSLLAAGAVSLSVTHLDGLVLARSAFHHSANYRSVNIFGTVERVEDPKEKMDALACILNHMVEGHWDNVRQPNAKEFKSTLVMRIDIDSASSKIRAEGVNDEKEDYQLPIWAGVVPIKQIALDPITDDGSGGIEIPDAVKVYVENRG